MKTIDLSDLKAGDKAWSAMHGEVTIKMVYRTGIIQTELKLIHYQNGTFFKDDTHPTLFHSEQEFREYWGLESNTLTKREQMTIEENGNQSTVELYNGNGDTICTNEK